jgi:hypothetical protein
LKKYEGLHKLGAVVAEKKGMAMTGLFARSLAGKLPLEPTMKMYCRGTVGRTLKLFAV